LKKILQILFFLSCCFVTAQQEAAIWYFGRNAGLDFNSGNPVPLTNGQLNTYEGCSTIADINGNLLFYTDGITVWNQNHTTMTNGFGLLGDPSSTQSGIIVPRPGDPNSYFIFTAGILDNPVGVNYSEVDMTQNGGLGAVTTKNVALINPTSEKLTAVQHANGTDYWVITHGWQNDAFYAFLVTAAGVSPTPVTSNVGIDLANPGPFGGSTNAIGYLKVSPDGTKIGIIHNNLGAELLQFNPATGVVSNAITLNSERGVYGIEFSPDSNVIYVGYGFFVGFNFELRANVYQYDVSTTNAVAIQNSATLVSPIQTIEIGALQLGIDGKIYVAQFDQTYLGVINNPNTLGLGCNYVENGVALAGRQSSLGLPPFVQSFFLSGILAENFCLGDGTEFSITSSEPILNIDWDFGDGNASTLENPTHTYAATGTYTVSVTVTTASDTATEVKDIVITDTPTANTLSDILGCTSYGSYNLDLPSFNPTITGTQDPADVIVNYFLSQQDADDNTNALDPIHSFDYGTTPVYVRVSNNTNSLCYETSQFNVIARQAPIVDVVTDWSVCDDDLDGQFTFDLTAKNTEIFNGQDQTLFEIVYFASQADADTGINPLLFNYTNTAASEEIFFRFQNSTYTTCFRTGSFMIEVLDGVVANTPTNLEVCDDNNDGQAIFDLTAAEAEVVGTQNPANLVISYHGTQADADSNSNPLSATNFQTTAYQTTIYVRVANTSDTSCYDTTLFQLNVFDTPAAPVVTDWQVCDDDNDDFYSFDLTEKSQEINEGSSNIVSYYESQVDAETNQNAIIGNYVNTTNPQVIYFRLENENNLACFDTGSFELQVFNTPIANEPEDVIVCDIDETGLYVFDLSVQDAMILNGQDPNFYEVSYHITELDAMNNESPVSKTAYQNSSLTETIYARIQHTTLDICYDTTSFSLLINPLPELNLDETYVICPDSPDLVIDAGIFETYEWRNESNNVVGTEQNFAVTELGTYQLTVTETANGITCSNTKTFEVVSSGAPETISISSSGFSDSITLAIAATGIGVFEYSIDGVNYQSSNEFEVFPGDYTVYVRDPFACRTLTDTIFVMGYEKFFTPNGDNSHENWNVIGATAFPDAKVTIYNRYGQLLIQMDANSIGWDGTYLGNPVPSSDYWFRFDTGEGQQMTGHFALKR
jgi:gliding motility-associated-like protein